MNNNPESILKFWFSERVKPLRFKKSPVFDQEIKQLFLNTYQQGKIGLLNHWLDNYQDTLALVILLDQFPRNMFRNTPQAFATDKQAVRFTKYALKNKYEQELKIDEQTFLYMPLMHSENKTDQAKCVELFRKLGKTDSLKFALKHQKIIDRFGRFPHRNKILGRESTSDELEFLHQPGSSF